MNCPSFAEALLLTPTYSKGLDVVPQTLEIGDYVITDEVCIERKVLSLSLSAFLTTMNRQSKSLFPQFYCFVWYFFARSVPSLCLNAFQTSAFNLDSKVFRCSLSVRV